MNTAWKPITREEALKHPLYGVKNWLLVMAFVNLIGFLYGLGLTIIAASEADMLFSNFLFTDRPRNNFLRMALLLDSGVAFIFYLLLFTKHPNFRVVTTWLIIASFPIAATLSTFYPFRGLGESLIKSFVAWIFWGAIWITYLNRSRRVRVTFEHTVRTTEQLFPVTTQTGDATFGIDAPFFASDLKNNTPLTPNLIYTSSTASAPRLKVETTILIIASVVSGMILSILINSVFKTPMGDIKVNSKAGAAANAPAEVTINTPQGNDTTTTPAAAGGADAASIVIKTPEGEVKIDAQKMEAFAKQMEEIAKKMEQNKK